jgi:hypothetical protein
MRGAFGHQTPQDCREQLRRDLARFKAHPLNPDMASHFFLTAENLLDWVLPGRMNKNRRVEARDHSVLLRICSHVASAIKHFDVEARHHASVESTAVGGGYFAAEYWSPSYWGNAYWGAGRRLVINLEGDAAVELGSRIGAIELAEMIMEYWDGYALSQHGAQVD